MSETPSEHRRPHPQPMAAPYLEFDIARELEQLHGEAAWQSGHNAKTLVKYDGLRIVLIALKAHSSIPGHQTEGQISIQLVAGHIQVRAQGRTFDLRSGRPWCVQGRWPVPARGFNTIIVPPHRHATA